MGEIRVGADPRPSDDPRDDSFESDRPADELDDERDRDELRRRYYNLLQELRVLLPGTQIMVAFLVSVPFANRFTELGSGLRAVFGVALASGMGAVVVFVTPTALHRVGSRRSRSERLTWAIRMARAGLVLLAVSLTSSTALVAGLVYGPTASALTALVVAAAVIALWLVLPLGGTRAHRSAP
jgi:hypothetical protein